MKMYKVGDWTLHNGDYKKALAQIGDIDLIFTSPPYNIGSKCPKKLGDRSNGIQDPKSYGSIEGYFDNWPEDVYQEMQKEFIRWCMKRLKSDGVFVYNHKLRHRGGRLILPEEWIVPLFQEGSVVVYDQAVWDRKSTHNHCPRFLWPQSERLYVLCKPGACPYFKHEKFLWEPDSVNKGCGDVWQIARAATNGHNAPFPLEIARQVLRLWSKPNSLVCDPYAGSATTMLACIDEGRHFVGSELKEEYFKLAVQRIERRLSNVRKIG
jgi:DNA modification methylase